MKQFHTFIASALLLAICPFTAGATEIEPSMRPQSTSPAADRMFVAPLEEVGFIFDRSLKLYDAASVVITCDGVTVATPTGYEVSNYEGERAKQGALIAKFDKQNLPKGKTYTVSLAKGSVGWTECYNDIQCVNMDYSYQITVPETLGEGRTELKPNSPVNNSEALSSQGIYYGYEIAPVGTPHFLFYRDGVFVGEIPARVSWDWDLGEVTPDFPEKVNFDFGVRYALVLPAGSVSALYRDDIVNEEFTLDFIGYHQDEDAPLTYTWCSLFNDHSDVLNEVTFTYDSPVGVTEGAVIELYEGDCETLVKTAPAYLKTDVNCWQVCCDFGGFKMTLEKGYTLVIPKGAVYLQQFPDIKAVEGKVKIPGTAGISTITAVPDTSTSVYDLMGRPVANPVPGTLYIQNGRKFIFPGR